MNRLFLTTKILLSPFKEESTRETRLHSQLNPQYSKQLLPERQLRRRTIAAVFWNAARLPINPTEKALLPRLLRNLRTAERQLKDHGGNSGKRRGLTPSRNQRLQPLLRRSLPNRSLVQRRTLHRALRQRRLRQQALRKLLHIKIILLEIRGRILPLCQCRRRIIRLLTERK